MRTIPHSRPTVSEQDVERVVAALRHGHLGQGEEVARLEEEMSARFAGASVVAVSSGTAALYLALAALGVDRADGVVVPSYTCNSLYAAPAHCGARVVCADLADSCVTVGAGTVGAVLSSAVRAVVVPHTFGFLADVDGIGRLGVPVVEDCAHAFGGRFADGAEAGSKGRAAVFSFYATKLLPSGEGGACVTRDEDLAGRVREWRNCDGRAPDRRAFNFRMSDLCASLVLGRLDAFERTLRERAALAAQFDEAFGSRSMRRQLRQRWAVPFRYLVRTDRNPEAVIGAAAAAGVTCRRPVYRPLHRTVGGDCPRTDAVHDSVISIPFYPGLTDAEIRHISKALPGLVLS